MQLLFIVHWIPVKFTSSIKLFTFELYFLQNYSGNHSCQFFFPKNNRIFFTVWPAEKILLYRYVLMKHCSAPLGFFSFLRLQSTFHGSLLLIVSFCHRSNVQMWFTDQRSRALNHWPSDWYMSRSTDWAAAAPIKKQVRWIYLTVRNSTVTKYTVKKLAP